MEIDPRGPRFAASITTVVLAVVLVTGSARLNYDGSWTEYGSLVGAPIELGDR
jgi:3-mercaptopyruvate sulfurtransferase SseA